MYNEQTGKPGSHSEKIHICQQIKTAVSITEAAVFYAHSKENSRISRLPEPEYWK